MPNITPVYMFARPENTRVEGREMELERVRAIRIGRRVPRSPREPEISERGEERMVRRLCWWIRMMDLVVERRWVFKPVIGWKRRGGRDDGRSAMLQVRV